MAGRVSKITLELFYDVVSPYSWIAFEVLTRYKRHWNVDLHLKPFFLGGIMSGAGNAPPGLVPNKFMYMTRDLARQAEFCKMPIQQPAEVAEVMFVKGTLGTMRYVTAVDMVKPQFTEELSRQLWLRIWSRDEDVTEPQSLLEAAKRAGLADDLAQEALDRMKSAEVKDQLKACTNRALDKGAFGAPTILVHKDEKEHLFFGCDRMELLAHFIGEKYYGPLASESKL